MKTMNLKRATKAEALKGDFHATRKLRPAKNPKRMVALATSPVLWRVWTGSFALKLLVLFFGMALWGCQKDKVQTTVIEGRITELGSFEPVRVAGLRLGLYKDEFMGNYPSGSTLVEEIITNTNGEFYLKIHLEYNAEAYFLKLLDNPDEYILLSHSKRLTSKSSNLVQFELHREAWIKLILNNEGGSSFDYFVFAINGRSYTHTGSGKPSVIQRVPSFYQNRVSFADHRTIPETLTFYEPEVTPNDTLEFVIDLRPQ